MATLCTTKPQSGHSRFCEFLETRAQVPVSFMIDATTRCQLKCRYCYFGNKGRQTMNVDRVMRATATTAALFGRKTESVNFHYMGGEPLLAWDRMLALNERARQHFDQQGVGFSWSLTSNLVGLDQRKADWMIAEKAGIHCSIDGPAFIHNRNRPFRNGQPSFRSVVKNIPRALAITPNDTARVTICPEDVGHLLEIAETVWSLGFKTVGLFPAYNMGWDGSTIETWTENLAVVLRHTEQGQGNGRRVSTMVKRPSRCKKKQPSTTPSKFTYCGAGKALWAFDVKGGLYFCHHLTNQPNFKVADAATGDGNMLFRAIEQSPQPPRRQTIPEGCKACPALSFCNGGCWSSNLVTNADAAIPEAIECQMRIATARVMMEHPSPVSRKHMRLPLKAMSECFRCDECQRCYSCEGCQSSCDEECQNCQTCQRCDSCQSRCEQNCESRCESSCQDRCESHCQNCESCEWVCDRRCQGCDSCESCTASERD